jgi:hypothetical protein
MDMTPDELSELARDRVAPKARRRKAQAEEKERKMRNRQKRESY